MTSIKTRNPFTKPARRSILGLRISALGEMLLALLIFLLIDYLWLDHTRYWATNPHPFWFIVLFIACKYGTREGLVSALLCSLALLVWNMPSQRLDQDGYAYTLAVLRLPILWLVSAVLFGELRQMHMSERDRLEISLQESEERERHIAQSYEWVRELKDRLELKMAGQLRSSIAAYHAAKSLESMSPFEVTKGLEELVDHAIHPEKFSIYGLDKQGLTVHLFHGWADSDHYARQFDAASPLYEAVVGRKETVCVISAAQEHILNGQGIMAGPLIDRASGEVVGMLKIEQMHFIDLHLSNIETFRTICEWAGMAMVNARKYQISKASSIINPEHNLLTRSYFIRYADYMSSLAKRVNFDLSMIVVRLTQPEKFSESTRTQIARALSQSVDGVLRTIDLAFDHQENNEEYSILLPATNRDGAQVVLNKIREALQARVSKITPDAIFAFTIQTVYDKRKS